MSNSFLHSWASVERGLVDYFGVQLGTIEGVQGYTVDTLPRTMPDDSTDFYIWMFKIDGGSNVIQRQSRDQIVNGAWHMDAMFQAWATTDYLAKQIAGAILDALPAVPSDGIDGLARLYNTAWPNREWVVRGVLNDQRAGDERRFVQLTIPMAVAFGNTAKID